MNFARRERTQGRSCPEAARASHRTEGCTRAREATWSTASARVAHKKTRRVIMRAPQRAFSRLIVKTRAGGHRKCRLDAALHKRVSRVRTTCGLRF